jgi:hypothetical protein
VDPRWQPQTLYILPRGVREPRAPLYLFLVASSSLFLYIIGTFTKMINDRWRTIIYRALSVKTNNNFRSAIVRSGAHRRILRTTFCLSVF